MYINRYRKTEKGKLAVKKSSSKYYNKHKKVKNVKNVKKVKKQTKWRDIFKIVKEAQKRIK